MKSCTASHRFSQTSVPVFSVLVFPDSSLEELGVWKKAESSKRVATSTASVGTRILAIVSFAFKG